MKFSDLKRGQIIHLKYKNEWDEYYLIVDKKEEIVKSLVYNKTTARVERAHPFYIFDIEEWTEDYSHFEGARLATNKEKQTLNARNWWISIIKSIFEFEYPES